MNNRLFLLLALLLALLPGLLAAQALQNNGAERNISHDGYIRLNYTNDFFTATDYYFTQGILLEVVHPALGKSPVYHILFRPPGWEVRYGMGLEHDGYTPVYYERPEIQYGDRPFAGALFLKTFTIAQEPVSGQRLSTALSTGIMGPAAGAGDMQVFIHKHTQNIAPQGWPNQVQNDVVLNYEMQYQRRLWEAPGYLLLLAEGNAALGTLSTKAAVGFTFMAGHFQSPFASLQVKGRKVQFYAYDHPELSVTGYDATLQGGLFNRSSSYTIAAGDISRLIFRNNWGLVARMGKLYLEYFQSFGTRAFPGVMDHRYGGIQIGWAF